VLVEFLVTPSFVAGFVFHEVYDNEAAFDEHFASARCQSFAAAIENEIEQRSVHRFAFRGESAEIVQPAYDARAPSRPAKKPHLGKIDVT
jgi:hypothetical protein